jgi:hypothetical protein
LKPGGIGIKFRFWQSDWEGLMKRHPSPNSKDWEQIAEDLQLTADNLPPGDDKETAQRKALQMRKAVEIRNWLTSPGVQPPR